MVTSLLACMGSVQKSSQFCTKVYVSETPCIQLLLILLRTYDVCAYVRTYVQINSPVVCVLEIGARSQIAMHVS